MQAWWLADRRRFLQEARAIAALGTAAEWLSGTRWHMDEEGWLCCDVTLHVHGHAYPVRLTYPKHFPDLAPAVKPLGDDRRWSFHQYGAGGVLCLEWGPDNWHTRVTGADLLSSTYRLLALENPHGDAEVPGQDAPSRHAESLGQELRRADLRGFLSTRMMARLGELVPWQTILLRSVIVPPDRVMVVTAAGEWQDPTVPEKVDAEDACALPGFAFKTTVPGRLFGGVPGVQDLVGFLKHGGVSKWPHEPSRPLEDTQVTVLAILLDSEGGAHGYLVQGEGGEDRERVRLVALLPDDRDQGRQEHGAELSVTVGVVGLGSLGSKVALSLARAGVKKFRLVDEDVLLPGNLVRHALDWRSVGRHKVDAVEQAIEGIAPDAAAVSYRLQLAGQESSQRHAEVVDWLGKSDLIIDATADGQVFNLLSMVSARSRVPMVWGQTYGGGLGGLVARSRPGVDPTPLQMRAIYQEFCREHPHEETQAAAPYSASGEEAPLMATDADVGVVAHHVAQLALDVITRPEASRYPHSMYLLGFRAGWVFDQPFQNLPVTMPDPGQWPEVGGEAAELSAAEQAELNRLCLEILKESKR